MSQWTKVSRALAALDAAGGVPLEQRVSIERRLKDGIQRIELLRDVGLTWGQIALGLPSWRQQDGTPITGDQIRGAVSRIRRTKQRPPMSKSVRSAPVVKAPLPPTRTEYPLGSKGTSSANTSSALGAQMKLTTKMRMG